MPERVEILRENVKRSKLRQIAAYVWCVIGNSSKSALDYEGHKIEVF